MKLLPALSSATLEAPEAETNTRVEASYLGVCSSENTAAAATAASVSTVMSTQLRRSTRM